MATKAIARRRISYITRSRSRSRGKGMSVSLAMIGGLTPMLADLMSAYRVGGGEAVLGHVSLCTTGYDPADGLWKPMFAVKKLYGPMFIAAVVHKFAGKLGINRMIAKSGIPIFRI